MNAIENQIPNPQVNQSKIENSNEFQVGNGNVLIINKFNANLEVQKSISNIPKYDTNKLIGRQDKLVELHNMLTKEKSAILMNGVGGIGKTTVALAYINIEEYKNEYKNIVWVTLTQSLKESILNTFLEEDIDFQYNKDEDSDNNFNHLLNNLKAIPGNNLLVIDNANNVQEILETKPVLENIHWKLLFTSRCSLPNCNEILVDELSHNDAIKLFLAFYKKDDREMLDELLEQINRHTLLTELLANVANEHPELNVKKVFELLKNWEIKDYILQSDIRTHHQINNEKKQAMITIGNYIYAIFEATELIDDEKKYLMYFSILPSVSIPYFDLKKYFGIEDTESTKFGNILKSLKRKGWLIESEKDKYKSHPLIQTVIREKFKPNVDNCKEIIISFTKMLHFETQENPLTRKELIPFAESILNFIKDNSLSLSNLSENLAEVFRIFGNQNKEINYINNAIKIKEILLEDNDLEFGCLFSKIAFAYSELGYYEKARDFINKATIIIEIMLKEKHKYKDLDLILNTLGLAYYNLGNYKKALDSYLIAIEIKENLSYFEHPDLASYYNNISLVYHELGKYEKALEFNLKDLQLSQKFLPDNHPDFTISYMNIAETYRELKDYEKALEYNLRDIELSQKIKSEDHLSLAISFGSIALTHQKLGNYIKALEFHKKDIELSMRVLDENHPHLPKSFFDISLTYYYNKDFRNAKYYINQAVEIRKIALPQDHPDLIKSLEWQKKIYEALVGN